MFFRKKKKTRVWPYIILLTILIFAGLVVLTIRSVSKISPADIINSPVIEEQVVKRFGDDGLKLLRILPTAFGFQKPVTYLLLFQNNTEMRPGGGFIGTYAVVKMEDGKPEILIVDGTENLDNNAPASWRLEPPAPMKKYLRIDNWEFRDSNWSPDFSVSAKEAIRFYRGEDGFAKDQISTVVALTPTVLEELLRLTGPITVDGFTFEADTVTEELEYEVEFGYRDRGIHFTERKKIIEPFFRQLLDKASKDFIGNTSEYISVVNKMIREKHILAYSEDPQLDQQFAEFGLAGTVEDTEGDYLMWVDANLAALKTDHAMERVLQYSIEPYLNRGYIATVSMKYSHTGQIDFRTSRYTTYARVYVPEGSELVEVTLDHDSINSEVISNVDQGAELGKQWFGTTVRVPVGDDFEQINYKYRLPDRIARAIDEGGYTLLAQKQPGLPETGLTINHVFGTNEIESAEPAGNFESNLYTYFAQMREDQSIAIKFKK